MSEIYLLLKAQPKSGKRLRKLGRTRKGVWYLIRDEGGWMRKDACWFVNTYILQHNKLFNFNLCKMRGITPNGPMEGFFCPEYVLLKHANLIEYYDTYEEQVPLFMEDLTGNEEEAKRKLRELKALLGILPPPPKEDRQGDLF